MPATQASLEKLSQLLANHPDTKNKLVSAIEEANEKEVKNLDQFYEFLNGLLTHIPTDGQLNADTEKLWYILNQAPGDGFEKDEPFHNWLRYFIENMGSYMDTTDSVKAIDTFIKEPKNKVEEYIQPASGWLTYNQFLSRQVKPGKRPVADRCNDDVVVSPTDSKYLGKWDMESNATITVKGDTYNMSDLLAGSQYTKHFKDGLFTHSYLSVYDYHRYHTPIGGTIVEKKIIPGRNWTNEVKRITVKKPLTTSAFNSTRQGVISLSKQITLALLLWFPLGWVLFPQ